MQASKLRKTVTICHAEWGCSHPSTPRTDTAPWRVLGRPWGRTPWMGERPSFTSSVTSHHVLASARPSWVNLKMEASSINSVFLKIMESIKSRIGKTYFHKMEARLVAFGAPVRMNEGWGFSLLSILQGLAPDLKLSHPIRVLGHLAGLCPSWQYPVSCCGKKTLLRYSTKMGKQKSLYLAV